MKGLILGALLFLSGSVHADIVEIYRCTVDGKETAIAGMYDSETGAKFALLGRELLKFDKMAEGQMMFKSKHLVLVASDSFKLITVKVETSKDPRIVRGTCIYLDGTQRET